MTQEQIANREIAENLFVSLGEKDWFSITRLRQILKLLNREHMTQCSMFRNLEKYHCINWSDMPPSVQDSIALDCGKLCGFTD